MISIQDMIAKQTRMARPVKAPVKVTPKKTARTLAEIMAAHNASHNGQLLTAPPTTKKSKGLSVQDMIAMQAAIKGGAAFTPATSVLSVAQESALMDEYRAFLAQMLAEENAAAVDEAVTAEVPTSGNEEAPIKLSEETITEATAAFVEADNAAVAGVSVGSEATGTDEVMVVTSTTKKKKTKKA